jgi:hypothetical protein
MRTKVKANADFGVNNATKNVIWLLKAIKGVMLQFEGQNDPFLSLDDAVEKLYSYRQGSNKSVQTLRDKYILLVDVVKHYGGAYHPHPALLAAAKGETATAKLQWVHDRRMARRFLKRADPQQFRELKNDLKKLFA